MAYRVVRDLFGDIVTLRAVGVGVCASEELAQDGVVPVLSAFLTPASIHQNKARRLRFLHPAQRQQPYTPPGARPRRDGLKKAHPFGLMCQPLR